MSDYSKLPSASSGRPMTPREEIEQISKGKQEPHNIDRGNRVILEAEKANMLLVKPAFRGNKWSMKMLEIERNLKKLDQKS